MQQGCLEYAIALIDDIWLDMTSRGWRGLVVNLSLKAMHFCYNDVAALLQNTFRIWGKKDGGAAFWHLIGRLKKGCQKISHKQPNSGNFGVQ